jgi:hypothetical protein
MARTFGQLAAKLQEDIHSFTPAKARQAINEAYLTIAEGHPWQHLLKRFTLQTEAEYSTGTIAITENTTSVALTDGAWVVAWGTAPSMRRMEIEGRDELYDVTIFPTTTSATLADTYIGDTLTAGTYNLFRDTYPLPTDCGYAKLAALYDPSQRSGDRGRLYFFLPGRYIRERAFNARLTGVPQCFTLMSQTSETPPRPQLQMYPAPDEVRAYHGWYFRRPALMSADGEYPDWPAEFEDMLPAKAALDHFSKPMFYSRRFIDHYMGIYSDRFRQMKKDMDGQAAMDKEIEGTISRPHGFTPFAGSSGEGSVSW